MSNGTCNIPCGNSQCYPIFVGRRITSGGSPPNTPFDVANILQCTSTGYTLYKRIRTGTSTNAQVSWQQVPNTTGPFVFYDVACELVCLINFMGLPTQIGTTSSLLGAVSPSFAAVTPVTTNTLSGTSTYATTTTASNVSVPAGSSLVTVTAPPGTTPTSVANSINAAGLLFSPAPAGQSVNANLVRADPTGAYFNVSQLRDSQLFVGSLQIPGPHQAGNSRIPVSMVIHGRAFNKSIVSVADAGAYTAGHAVNCSILHSDNDASHTHALAHDNSKALALGHGSTTAGQAGCGSTLQSGGIPNFRHKIGSSRYQIMIVGAGVVQHRGNVYALNRTSLCPKQSILLEDTTPDRTIPPLNCQVCTDTGTGDHAPGHGHGSLAHGVAVTNSLLQTAGDGAVSIGVAKCAEIHAAVGLASQAFGRNNLALSPYSMATGQNSVTHMYGQQAQGIHGAPHTNVLNECNMCQYVRVMTHSHVDCSIIPSTDGTTITGFLLTYRLVLGSTPVDPVISTPDGVTVTNYHLPSLVCPGIAGVETEVVSPAITGPGGTPIIGLDGFTASYCYSVTRTDMNGQNCHTFLPPGILTPNCAFAPTGTTIPPAIIDADPSDNICGGFTLIFTETINVSPNVPNPRITPTPTPTNLLLISRSTFQIITRLMCATFKWTQAPAGFARVACVPAAAHVTTVVTTPNFTAIPPPNFCPTPFGGGPTVIGNGAAVINGVNTGGGVVGVSAPTNIGYTGCAQTTSSQYPLNASGGGVVGATGPSNIGCTGCAQTTSTQYPLNTGGQVVAGPEFAVADPGNNFDSNAFNFIQGMNQQFGSH
jgi:hypothetical protein